MFIMLIMYFAWLHLSFNLENIEKNMKKHGLAVTANGEKSQIPSKFIIHIDVSGGNYKKKMVEALNKVEEMKLKTVAFPAMGTGMIYILHNHFVLLTLFLTGTLLVLLKYYYYCNFIFLFKVKVISPNLWKTLLTKCSMLLINCTQMSNTWQKFTSLSLINKWLKSSSWLCSSAFSPKILNQRDGLRSLQITYQVVVGKIS